MTAGIVGEGESQGWRRLGWLGCDPGRGLALLAPSDAVSVVIPEIPHSLSVAILLSNQFIFPLPFSHIPSSSQLSGCIRQLTTPHITPNCSIWLSFPTWTDTRVALPIYPVSKYTVCTPTGSTLVASIFCTLPVQLATAIYRYKRDDAACSLDHLRTCLVPTTLNVCRPVFMLSLFPNTSYASCSWVHVQRLHTIAVGWYSMDVTVSERPEQKKRTLRFYSALSAMYVAGAAFQTHLTHRPRFPHDGNGVRHASSM